ncbi:MAG: hypothetical protein V1743_06265, partial [Nanoarchaeota archaeon]
MEWRPSVLGWYWLYGVDVPVGAIIRVVYYAPNGSFGTNDGPEAWDNVTVESYNGTNGPYWDSQERYQTYARIQLPLDNHGMVD